MTAFLRRGLQVLFSLVLLWSVSFTGAEASTVVVTTDQDIIAKDGLCSLREAVISVNNQAAEDACSWSSTPSTYTLGNTSYSGDIIEFDTSLNSLPIVLTLTGISEDLAATGDLDLQRNVLIRGNGRSNTVIDGNANDRVFHSFSAPVVALEALTVQNGAITQGSGILSYGRLDLNDVLVTSNQGDGVQMAGGDLTMAQSALTHNRMNGLYVAAGSNAHLEDSFVENNRSCGIENKGDLRLDRSEVTGSWSDGICSDTAGLVDLRSSLVQFNSWHGISEKSPSGQLRLDDVDVLNSGLNGIYSEGSVATSNGTQISYSNSSGVYLYTQASSLVMDDTLLEYNRSRGVYNAGAAVLQISNSTLQNNGLYGLENEGAGSITLDYVSILSNQASGIKNQHASLDIYNSNISYNNFTRFSYGGGIQSLSGTQVLLDNTSLIQNVGWTYGGGLYLLEATAELRNGTTLAYNMAEYGGGIALRDSDLILRDGSIISNTANYNGGGVYALSAQLSQPSQLEIYDSSIDENAVQSASSSAAGGGLYLIGELVMEDSTVNDNVIWGSNASQGGGIYAKGALDIKYSDVSRNEAALQGGGLYLDTGSDLLLVESTFHKNQVTEESSDGGAIYAIETPVVSIYNHFLGNSAERYGGAIHHAYEDLQLVDTRFESNVAALGGALSVSNGRQLEIEGGQFSGNAVRAVTGKGGALYVNALQAGRIENSSFASNTAYSGAGLYETGVVTLDLLNSTFRTNMATYGGALYTHSPLLLDQVTLSGNIANHGAGVYHNGGSTLQVDLSTVAYNTGVGLEVNAGSLDLLRSVVADNSTNCSGPIQSLGYNLSNSGCNLSHSTDLAGTPAQLQPTLMNNGGPTWTHMPQAGSPLVDASFCVSSARPYDQRGFSRIVGSQCDIGAVERQN